MTKVLRVGIRKVAGSLLILGFIFSGLTGCDDRAEGVKLAETGIEGSTKLAEFYDSLAEDLTDTLDYEYFNSAIRQTPIDDRAKVVMEEQIVAIKARAKMARSLGNTYAQLKSLSDYDAGQAVGDSATKLADTIKGLPVLPGASVIPSKIIGMVAQDIVNWKQSRDIRKGSQLLAVILGKIKILISRELDAYESISIERGNKAGVIIEYLVTHGKVTSLALLQKVPTSLNLKLVGADAPIPTDAANKDLRDGLIAIAIAQFDRQATASAGEGNAVLNVIDELATAHRAFGREHGAGIVAVGAWIERAQAYLDEINKLRNKKGEK